MADIINATIEESKIDVAIEEVQIDVTLEGAIIEQQGGGNGGIPNGDKGDIVVSNAGTTWTIENMNENATVTTGTYSSKVNQAVLIKARKASAGTITKGQVVYITGSSGTHLLVELAKANVEATSAYTIGIAATTITGSNDGFVMQNGRLTGLSTLPTATFDDGDALYLSEATAGAYRVGIPTAPNHGVFLGFAVKTSNGNTGEIDVRVDNYQELEELSDVYINGETTNDFLIRKATRWENTSLANTKTILAINNVDNTSDLNKPISTATQTALNTKQDNLGYTAENIANKGVNNGYASLDNAGKVPTGQLPSYVDDVLEFANLAGFPITGETGKIYVAIDTGIIYRWSGSVYIEISSDTQAVWGNITGTLSNQTDLQNALNAKENTITAGTTGQYYRGDKTFQTLDKTAVGLGNVSNTDTTTTANITDSTNKRFITDAQQTVLTNTSNTNTGDQNLFSTIAVTGQSNVVADNTSDTLTLVAGSNITLTTNATNDEITIAGITYPQLLSAISLRI